ncbi:hypothetical protein TNCV_3416011 [Trichonephila clavipes]|nr:hypothetical protein TNCV_3416011 [Trichonephila clavipes]
MKACNYSSAMVGKTGKKEEKKGTRKRRGDPKGEGKKGQESPGERTDGRRRRDGKEREETERESGRERVKPALNREKSSEKRRAGRLTERERRIPEF